MASGTWQALRAESHVCVRVVVVYAPRTGRLPGRPKSRASLLMIRATICCVVAFFAVAQAAPKVALPAIEGDETGDMRDAVAAAIDGEQITVLGERETNRAVDSLRNENLAELTEKQATKLSKDLEDDAT